MEGCTAGVMGLPYRLCISRRGCPIVGSGLPYREVVGLPYKLCLSSNVGLPHKRGCIAGVVGLPYSWSGSGLPHSWSCGAAP